MLTGNATGPGGEKDTPRSESRTYEYAFTLYVHFVHIIQSKPLLFIYLHTHIHKQIALII